MLSLLPEREKKQILEEYRLRTVIVALSFLAIVGFAAIFLLIPSYLVVFSQKQEIEGRLASVRNSSILREAEALNAEIVQANLKIKSLNEGLNFFRPSGVIEKALSRRGSNIHISSVNYRPKGKDEVELALRGIARDRDYLSNFVKTLQEEQSFFRVDIPVSDFTKGENASFTISIVLKLPK